MSFFEVKGYTKEFDDVQVLKGIDLQINKGEAITIIGSSGSGKTTLLRCINFLETPDNGEMFVDGEEIYNSKLANEYTDEQLRKKRLNFGLVFQSFNLFPQYNVIDNITLAPKMLLEDKVKALKKELRKQGKKFFERKALVKEFINKQKEEIEKDGLALIEKIGLTEKIKSYPCELSGGQCQRVAIARALALKPKILCFDEPTSALDPELTGEVLKVIRALKEEDRTMIIVTHEMGFAKHVSDKVIFMADGVIEEAGTPEEIFDNPKSEKLKSFLSNVDNKEGA